MDTHSPSSGVLRQLAVLGEVSRSRLLAVLEWSEFTVSELCSVLQMPQSTVSRHLNTLAQEGWVVSRAEQAIRPKLEELFLFLKRHMPEECGYSYRLPLMIMKYKDMRCG